MPPQLHRVTIAVMNGYRMVIWDWNGTLLDDFEVVRNIANGMLRRRGLPEMNAHRYREIFDFPISEYYRRAGFNFDEEPYEILADEFILEFNARIGDCNLHSVVPQLLEELNRNGIRQAILSAGRDTTLIEALEHHGIGRYFEEIQGLSDHLAVSKTNAGRDLIARIDLKPEEIVMIGDTLHDHEVAEALGIDCILVATGHQSEERLRATGAPVFPSLEKLRNAAT